MIEPRDKNGSGRNRLFIQADQSFSKMHCGAGRAAIFSNYHIAKRAARSLTTVPDKCYNVTRHCIRTSSFDSSLYLNLCWMSNGTAHSSLWITKPCTTIVATSRKTIYVSPFGTVRFMNYIIKYAPCNYWDIKQVYHLYINYRKFTLIGWWASTDIRI